MGLYQSFQQVFVTNVPALLAQGKTVDSLAVGQVGFLDGKTYTAVTAPTYAKNKALYAVWGTPDLNAGEFGGVPNENEYSKLIKGKLVRKVRAKKAKRGVTPVYTVGWSGDVADTDTLFAKAGERKSLFIKLTGTIIDRLYDKQGIIKEFVTTPACIDDCSDTCTDVKCPDLANELVAQINSDKDFKKFIKAKSIISCTGVSAPSTTNCYQFLLSVCDTGDDAALGQVQAQYPNDSVSFVSRVASISTYAVVRSANTTPTAYTTTAVIVPDCPVCPSGYTFTDVANVYTVKTATTVTAGNVHSAFTGEGTVTLLNSDPSFNTFVVLFPTTVADSTVQTAAAAARYIANFVGLQQNICTQTTPTTVTWVSGATLNQQTQTYTLTIGDSVCGTNRLADLQAAYPSLTISVVNSGGSCVHTYQTSVPSNCYLPGCAIEEITFTAPAMFEGVEWVLVPVTIPDNAVCQCGIQLETAFFNINTNDCTFDYFPYENDIVHIQISNYNPDFNADPCEKSWAVKQIRQVQFPQGHGQYVQKLEKESKQYDQRFRSWDPVVREVQGYSLQADPTKFYDQYVLEYETKFLTSGGWSEQTSQSIHLNIFVPEGTGVALENLLNSYVTSAGLDEDAIAI